MKTKQKKNLAPMHKPLGAPKADFVPAPRAIIPRGIERSVTAKSLASDSRCPSKTPLSHSGTREDLGTAPLRLAGVREIPRLRYTGLKFTLPKVLCTIWRNATNMWAFDLYCLTEIKLQNG